MSEFLPALDVSPKSGAERFHAAGASLGFDLLRFWQWSASDLASNAMRGRLAEFLVGQALGIVGGVRAEWDAFDLRTPQGVTIEVKSAAYLQTWAQKAPSIISFDIRPTRSWESRTNGIEAEPRRQADLYVFALLSHRDKSTLDPMDLAQWAFFVLPTAVLNAKLPTRKRVSLYSLFQLAPEQCGFPELRLAVERVTSSSA